MLNEMLSHLERQPRNKERRIAWLKYIEPVLNSVGLVLLVHFRRIFPLFLKWMHADDDETVLLVRIFSIHLTLDFTSLLINFLTVDFCYFLFMELGVSDLNV